MRRSIVEKAKYEFFVQGFDLFNLKYFSEKYSFSARHLAPFYTTKDDLFCDVLSPLTNQILHAIYHDQSLSLIPLHQYEREIFLLCHRSSGSSLQHFFSFALNENISNDRNTPLERKSFFLDLERSSRKKDLASFFDYHHLPMLQS